MMEGLHLFCKFVSVFCLTVFRKVAFGGLLRFRVAGPRVFSDCGAFVVVLV